MRVLGDGKPSNLRTISCQAFKKGEGRLVVEYKKSASAEQLQQIDKLANELIKKNLEVRSFTLPRYQTKKTITHVFQRRSRKEIWNRESV